MDIELYYFSWFQVVGFSRYIMLFLNSHLVKFNSLHYENILICQVGNFNMKKT